MTSRQTKWYRAAAAFALAAGCGEARILSEADGGTVDAGAPGDLSGMPTCVPGIRETACTTPGEPLATLSWSDGTLEVPLHPELDRPCARSRSFVVSGGRTNVLAVMSVALTGATAFTIGDDQCSGRALVSPQACSVLVCFSSRTSGWHYATLTVTTDGGALDAHVSGDVMALTPGLDPSFAGTGIRLVSDRPGLVRGALLNDGASIVVWDPGESLRFVSAAGALSTPPAVDVLAMNGFSPNWFTSVTAGGPGQGLFALTGVDRGSTTALVRLLDDGTLDLAFGDRGAASLAGSVGGPNLGIAAQPSGRVLLFGAGARAFSSGGREDPAYRTDFAGFAYAGSSAVDDRGRLYLSTTAPGVVRLGADGGIDWSFSTDRPVNRIALDRDQRLLVAADTLMPLERLDETGVASPLPLDPRGGPHSVVDIAVDERRRMLLTSGDGFVYRYLEDGTFDSLVGFGHSGASQVICPREGGCTIIGVAAPGSAVVEAYLMRLAP